MKVLAIIPTYNEVDILPAVLRHLRDQEVDTYVIDNWSTDKTWECPDRPITTEGYEFFPTEPVHVYQWERILRRVEEVALRFSGEYDWMMLHDADEIRRPPNQLCWPSLPHDRQATLVEGINAVNSAGYNMIDFQVYTFPMVDNGWEPGFNPEIYFTKYLPDSGYSKVPQEKCWKSYPGVRVDIASSGGHRALYTASTVSKSGILATGLVDRRVCPHKFILKHYPIRSQRHGERKVFEERKKRWHLGERGKQWHTQYDGIEEGHNFLADPKELIEWK